MTQEPAQADRMRSRVVPGLVWAATVLLLAGCAPAAQRSSEKPAATPQDIRQADRPLMPATDGSAAGIFDVGFARGALDSDGDWRVRGEITHSRLRCGRYQLGVRFGAGDASCANVDWRTELLTSPERRQCNSATLVHTGGGTLDLSTDTIASLNCARVVVRCTGACR